MAFLKASRTHTLRDNSGELVGYIYRTNEGIPIVQFLDEKEAHQTDQLIVGRWPDRASEGSKVN